MDFENTNRKKPTIFIPLFCGYLMSNSTWSFVVIALYFIIFEFTAIHLFNNELKDKYIKGMWFCIILFIPIIGMILYFIFRNKTSLKESDK